MTFFKSLSSPTLQLFLATAFTLSIDISNVHAQEVATPTSSYYDISNSEIPEINKAFFFQALSKLEALLKDKEFLAIIDSKDDWTYAPNGSITGSEVVAAIAKRVRIDDGTEPFPILRTYERKYVGEDTCGGISVRPFRKTSVKGCAKHEDGQRIVYKETRELTSDVDRHVGSFAHEWMHSIGFSHAGNRNQHKKKKSNSVPIFVGCVAMRHLADKDVSQCALAKSRRTNA